MTPTTDDESTGVLNGRRVSFQGKLGGVTKREAQRIVRQHGGSAVELKAGDYDLMVIGADELPLDPSRSLLSEDTRRRVADGDLEIMSETQFWQMLGVVENEHHVRRLYTPAMLADLLDVSVVTIRRWHRRGLIVPARQVHRLPYFDFQEVATARHLAQLLTSGASPYAIEKQLDELSRYLPNIDRTLAQLSVIVEGKKLLLRQGEGLVEPGGQLLIDFDALESAHVDAVSEQSTIEFATTSRDDHLSSASELMQLAIELEDNGELNRAIDAYRAVLAADGPHPEVCFHLAELLYRTGDIAGARERYFIAIELDEDYVEARANLGCVLLDLGDVELAIAAFQGALAHHENFPDAHYHLARALDESGRLKEADEHWRAFLRLAPDSPWAENAKQRISAQDPEIGADDESASYDSP